MSDEKTTVFECQARENCFLKQSKSTPTLPIHRYMTCHDSKCVADDIHTVPHSKASYCGLPVGCPDNAYRQSIQGKLWELMRCVQEWSLAQTPRSYNDEFQVPLQCLVMIVINLCAVTLMNYIQRMTENHLRPILASVIVGWLIHFKTFLQHDTTRRHEQHLFEPWTMVLQLSKAFDKVYEHMDRFVLFRNSCHDGFTVGDMVDAIVSYLSSGRMTPDSDKYPDCVIPKYGVQTGYLYEYMMGKRPEDRIMHCNAATTLVSAILSHTIRDLVVGIGTHTLPNHIVPVIIYDDEYCILEATHFTEKGRPMGARYVSERSVYMTPRTSQSVLYINDDVDPLLRFILCKKRFPSFTVVQSIPSGSECQSIAILVDFENGPDGTSLVFTPQHNDIYEFVFLRLGVSMSDSTRIDDGAIVTFHFSESLSLSQTSYLTLNKLLRPVEIYVAEVRSPSAQSIQESSESILSNFILMITTHYDRCIYVTRNDYPFSNQIITDELSSIHARQIRPWKWFIPFESAHQALNVRDQIQAINLKVYGGKKNLLVNGTMEDEGDIHFDDGLKAMMSCETVPQQSSDPRTFMDIHVEGTIRRINILDVMFGEWMYGCDMIQRLRSADLRSLAMEFQSNAEQGDCSQANVKQDRNFIMETFFDHSFLKGLEGESKDRKRKLVPSSKN